MIIWKVKLIKTVQPSCACVLYCFFNFTFLFQIHVFSFDDIFVILIGLCLMLSSFLCVLHFNVVFLLWRCSPLIFDAFPSVLVCNPDLFFSVDLWVSNSGILLLPLFMTINIFQCLWYWAYTISCCVLRCLWHIWRYCMEFSLNYNYPCYRVRLKKVLPACWVHYKTRFNPLFSTFENACTKSGIW